MASDEEDRGGRRNARRMWRIVRATFLFMIVAVALDHVFFGDEAVLTEAERAQEAGTLGAVYRVEHKVEHAIEHTLHDIGAGIDRGLHTHVFHRRHDGVDDDDENLLANQGGKPSSSSSRDWVAGAGGERGYSTDDAHAATSHDHASTMTTTTTTTTKEGEGDNSHESVEPAFRDVSNLKFQGSVEEAKKTSQESSSTNGARATNGAPTTQRTKATKSARVNSPTVQQCGRR